MDGTVLGSTVAIAYVLLQPESEEIAVLYSLLVTLAVLPSLVMLYGLTCDGGKSFTSRALQLPAAKWLGSISYSLYLSHDVIEAYVVFMLDSSGDSVECSGHSSQYSPWLILPLTAAALPVAWLLYTCVEEPSRRYLCCLGDGAQAPTDSGSAWGSFVVADTERLSDKASDDGRATLLEGNQDSVCSHAI